MKMAHYDYLSCYLAAGGRKSLSSLLGLTLVLRRGPIARAS